MLMLDELLSELVKKKASDLYIAVGLPPTIKVNAKLISLNDQSLTEDGIYSLLAEVVETERITEFKKKKEANFALNLLDIGRFRVSAFMQKDTPSMVIRHLKSKIPTFEELYLPEQLKKTCMAKRGLILFVGATGSGKSTTQAAMIGYRNQHASGHILTVEDPIEFVHEHGRSVVTQREVGLDTDSFEEALRNSLRQAADVIVQGEIRTYETLHHAITFAETGHLCMGTLHANNANQALDRMLRMVPEETQRQFLFDLSINLTAVIAQHLIPTSDGKGSIAAFEIMLNTPTLEEAIRNGDLHLLKDIMKVSGTYGMQTFDQALLRLYLEGKIGYNEALAHADSANDLRLRIKLKAKENGITSNSEMLNDLHII